MDKRLWSYTLFSKNLQSVICFSDFIDLWIIEIEKPIILCTCSTSRSSEQSMIHRSRSKNMWKVCLFYSQNTKIVWLSNMADTFFEKFPKCAKVCGLFFLIVLFGCWLVMQTTLITWYEWPTNLAGLGWHHHCCSWRLSCNLGFFQNSCPFERRKIEASKARRHNWTNAHCFKCLPAPGTHTQSTTLFQGSKVLLRFPHVSIYLIQILLNPI